MSIIQKNNLRSDLSVTVFREWCMYQNDCTTPHLFYLFLINLIYSLGWKPQLQLSEALRRCKVVVLPTRFFFLSCWWYGQEGRQVPSGLCCLTSQWNYPLLYAAGNTSISLKDLPERKMCTGDKLLSYAKIQHQTHLLND